MSSTICLFVLSSVYFLLVAGHGAPLTASFSFDFDFSNNSTFSLDNITTAGDAAFHGGLYDLTRRNEHGAGIDASVGRVAYAHPVPLREDNATGQVASFTTAFSFAITTNINSTDRDNKTGGGMAFFLGQYPSVLPPNSSAGFLGLCTGDDCANKTAAGKDRFAAVEFDTFNNTWDPNVTSDHMGIDVNSIVSVATISLPTNSLNGTMSARVDYNGSTGVLNVALQLGPSPMFYGATPTYNISAKVDLNTVLPEQVAIGFSAATGAAVGLHQLLSWSFSLVTPGNSSSTCSTSTDVSASSSSRMGLKVALGITSFVSLLLFIAVLALLGALRRKNLALAEMQLDPGVQSRLMAQVFDQGSGSKSGELSISPRLQPKTKGA